MLRFFRFPALFWLIAACLLCRWGWRYPSWLGDVIMGFALLQISMARESHGPQSSQWRSPILWTGTATAAVGITFIGGWLLPEQVLTPWTIVIFAVALVAFVVGLAVGRFEARPR